MVLNDLMIFGFEEKKEWEFKETSIKNYILKTKKNTYRAIYTNCNGIPYFQIGILVNEKGIVDRWRDVCTNEALNKLII